MIHLSFARAVRLVLSNRLCYTQKVIESNYPLGALYAEIDSLSGPFEPDLANTNVGKWLRSLFRVPIFLSTRG